MGSTLELDPSRPCQTSGDLLALWLPRGRGRDALARGLVATVTVCDNPACQCTTARLHAVLIDDRAEKVVSKGHRMRIRRRASPPGSPHSRESANLELDFTTGVVEEAKAGELPPFVAPFFAEPLPFWVLDHIWDRWRAPRLPSGIDWKSQALSQWSPDVMLSTMLAFPEERPDRYLVEGHLYQVDTMFCVDPDCDCTESRLSVLEISGDNKNLNEVGGARLPEETMVPQGYLDDGLDKTSFIRIYMEWRRRNVPARERLLELRELTRQRGLELLRFASARSRPAAAPQLSPPARQTKKPGRNAPCPCGSGKKYKRCCLKKEAR